MMAGCFDQSSVITGEAVLIGGCRASCYLVNQKANLKPTLPKLVASSENWKMSREWESLTQGV
jgi:hypothetical protein